MTEEKIAELLKIHELNHHIAQTLMQQREKMIATCIEDNDGESHVLHEVRQTIDCITYSITLSAEAPDLALKIAREIPLTYWKQE